MPKKAVLFDLDGTLLNSLPDISRCMNTVLEKHGLPVYPLSLIHISEPTRPY